MRQMTYEEIVELAKANLGKAITEAKINMKNDPSEGAWAGLPNEAYSLARLIEIGEDSQMINSCEIMYVEWD